MTYPNYTLELATDSEAKFMFTGKFQHKEVVWHVHLYTCTEYINKTKPRPNKIRQFIDIDKQSPNCLSAQVCLNIAKVNHAVILKTMIMLQQYKKLSYGRHEYGDTVQPLATEPK